VEAVPDSGRPSGINGSKQVNYKDMSLPVRLAQGMVSIYGANESDNNIKAPKDYRFGIVNETWNNLSTVAAVGQSVLFKIDESVPLNYSNTQYWIVDENKIILIEDIPL
jgi:hypothetical protein